MKTLNKIPTGKIERTGSLLKAGAKIGVNYIKYYGNKITKDEEQARQILNEENATDIYDSLKELKGSALKVAQMLSMEKNILPQAYVEKFSLSQFSVPPLSGALVKKTFRKYFGKNPEAMFDEFSQESVNAASIGQVHKAKKDGNELAVKIQYPGVRESISSDLKMVKPIAMKMFNIQKEGSESYFQEVESKLFEETDYNLELKRSQQISEECSHLPNLRFPTYYPDLSCEKIITMDWMNGKHFSEFTKQTHSQENLNTIGQTLWDFYMYQMHVLKQVHADPHPGNFLVSENNELLVIDFGCIKEIPNEFYTPYFELAKMENLKNPETFKLKLYQLEILRHDDTPEEQEFFSKLFYELLELFTRPFNLEFFDFSDEGFFQEIAELGQRYAKLNDMKGMNVNRGSKHFIYLNRTFFGLYNMMHDVRAKDIKINNYKNFIP
ncbi:Predicted unusual protein kinase regulating ubiquinone biosynthesis, AarF/ABC1/UbiB family [Chryseobacterium arachidis]|uniref:Predicted unusual protein kinase regulating ubiquinone biosynthesis, AarF/ABC1/UbiB family n=1 Tax=Chryseobacterium arachidis TaxID=1416778 RepID=A0A1M5HMZ0_9FLAO|nr:AarF/UbiB family protein [Chryseobacterium arachidis]SHG17297.1 Predicted unusual protein kinase regulating ubiquinone biosynthesis, AarF/ABC1/UbiB family [Chryseobacterium arachidis]